MDSLRGIACLIVLIAHILASIPSVGVRVSGCGKIGVWLLFILSGFWSFYPYCKNNSGFETGNILAFYVKRIFRIYPSYIIVLSFCVLLGYPDMDFHMLIKHILLLQGIGHFWTIPVEMKFYLIVPLILYICTKMLGGGGEALFSL